MAAESIRLSLLLLPFAGMSAGAASEITRLIFGPEFTSSGPILAWLISGAVLHVLVSVNSSILIAAGKTRHALFILWLLVPIAILAYMWVIPLLGPVGASMVTAGAYLIAAVASGIAVRTAWGLAIPFATLARSLALTVLAFAAAYWWSTAGLILVVKLCIICLAIPMFFYLAGELTKQDLSLVMSSLGRKTNSDSGHSSNTEFPRENP